MPRPAPGTYPESYTAYIEAVKEHELESAFSAQQYLVDDFFSSIPPEKAGYAYAPGKWTLKSVLQHIIDAERVFTFRALCFARNERQHLPGFSENEYADVSGADERDWNSLCQELRDVRRSTLHLFQSFTTEMISRKGIANNKEITVLALGFVIAGHLEHHRKVILERYLP